VTDARRPNILFLQTDQHRWDALGCVNPLVRTPNLDALAARGVRFSQAVCQAPMCVPSRHSMMLGLYPSQSGFRHNTQVAPDDEGLPAPPLARRLHDIGYQTAGFGKTHWYEGPPFFAEDVPFRRSTRGFEVRAVAQESEMEPGALCKEAELPRESARLREEKRAFGGGGEDPAGYIGRTSAIPGDLQNEGWLAGQALRFLEGGRDRKRPFFLYLSFNYPHAGLGVPPGYEELYDINAIPDRLLPPWKEEPEGHAAPPERWRGAWESLSPLERRRTTLRYWALCTFCDDLFGRIIRKIGDTGEIGNTLIVFTSDHGEMLGDRGHRFSKYCLYEGSVRVPLIISGSGVPEKARGTVDGRCAELIDIMPTMLEVSGEKPSAEFPGRNLLAPSGRQGGFAEMHGSGYEKVQPAPAYMWREPDWKLILYMKGPVDASGPGKGGIRGELYDLRADPNEWRNLYDDPATAGKREEMTARLLMHIGISHSRYPWHPEGKGWTI
jgi:arylsulfatase A-like enzyme